MCNFLYIFTAKIYIWKYVVVDFFPFNLIMTNFNTKSENKPENPFQNSDVAKNPKEIVIDWLNIKMAQNIYGANFDYAILTQQSLSSAQKLRK